MYQDQFHCGLTAPYVFTFDNEAPAAWDIIDRARASVLRLCSFTDFREFERAASSGIAQIIIRPKWHHGRGAPFLDDVLSASEWGEQTVEDCVARARDLGVDLLLEGPNEPDIECFADGQTESGLWYAQDPNIYQPRAEEFAYWWAEQMSRIRDRFPEIRLGSPTVSAGALDRATFWVEMLDYAYRTADELCSHDYAWHEDDGEGGVTAPDWGAQHVWLRDMHPDKPINITETNCDARLAQDDRKWWYPYLYEWFKAGDNVKSVCFFEAMGTPGQEKHWVEHDLADELGWYTTTQDTYASQQQKEKVLTIRDHRRLELAGYWKNSVLNDEETLKG